MIFIGDHRESKDKIILEMFYFLSISVSSVVKSYLQEGRY